MHIIEWYRSCLNVDILKGVSKRTADLNLLWIEFIWRKQNKNIVISSGDVEIILETQFWGYDSVPHASPTSTISFKEINNHLLKHFPVNFVEDGLNFVFEFQQIMGFICSNSWISVSLGKSHIWYFDAGSNPSKTSLPLKNRPWTEIIQGLHSVWLKNHYSSSN